MSERKIKASPATRNLARELGIDLGKVRGTGYEGRIQIEDIQDYINAGGETKGVNIKGLEIKSSDGKQKEAKIEKETIAPAGEDEISFDDFFENIQDVTEDNKSEEIEEGLIYENDDSTKKEADDIFESFDFVLKKDDAKENIEEQSKKEKKKEYAPKAKENSIKTEFGEIIHNSKGSKINDYIDADEDMIQFMIEHENDLRDELDGTVISNDSQVQIFTREYDESEDINKKSKKMQREDLEEIKDQIKGLYKAIENNSTPVKEEKKKTEPDNFVQEGFAITLNDESIGTVHLNIDEDDVKKLKEKEILAPNSQVNDLVISGHTHNSIAMGIDVKLKQVKKIVKHYDKKDNSLIMYIVVKAIAHAMKTNNINNFNDSLRLSKYTDDSSDFHLDDITNMKVSEFEDKKAIEKKDYLYEVLDLTSLGIDYYFPKESEGHVEIVILGDQDDIKIMINADQNILSFEETAKVLASIKEVIDNPSLMIV